MGGEFMELLFRVCDERAEPLLRPCAEVQPSINCPSWSVVSQVEFGEGRSEVVEGSVEE